MSNIIKRATLAGAAVMALISSNANAATFFTESPGSNSSDFLAAVAAAGGTVTTNADFETPTTDGTVTTVNFSAASGAGPGQGNTTFPILSGGEGKYVSSNFLQSIGAGTLTFTFASAVAGLGFTTIDLFNPQGSNDISLSVFSGANGTGTLLGSTTAANFNFQSNFTYFMGFTSDSNNIGSFVLTNPGGASDVFGVDNIVSAKLSPVAAVPEPATWAMMLLGFGFVGGALRSTRNKKSRFTFATA